MVLVGLWVASSACGATEEPARPSPSERPTLPSLPRRNSTTTTSTATSAPPAGGTFDVADAVAALPSSTFRVRYDVQGDPSLDDLELWWSSPRVRFDGSYAGYDFRNYLDGETGEWTLCVTIMGEYVCDSEEVPELTVLSQRLEQLAPGAAAQRVLELSEGPGALTELRSIAGEPVVCAVTVDQTGCLAATGALMYSEGVVTLSVNDGPAAPLVVEAVEYTTAVSGDELVP